MPVTKNPALQIGPRDEALLAAIDQAPFTTTQLLALSATFPFRFPDEHTLRRRLRQLQRAGLLQAFPYAVASLGRSPSYYKLAHGGYRLLHGVDVPLPPRRAFEPLAPAHHQHTQALSEFLVKLFVAAQERRVAVRHFAKENSVTIDTPEVRLRPDCSFQLAAPDRPPLNFVVELDNGTERVRSQQEIESIERKIRGYDADQSLRDAFDPQRYVVLFVTTRSSVRLDSILATARTLVRNPQRRLFLGVTLADFCAHENPLFAACCRDVTDRLAALVPPTKRERDQDRASFRAPAVAFC